MRRTKLPEVRFIKPEVIRIGDTIKVEWQDKDVTMCAVGTVADRKHYGVNATEWVTTDGKVLLARFGIDHAVAGAEPLGMYQAKVTLIKAAPELTQPTLDIMM